MKQTFVLLLAVLLISCSDSPPSNEASVIDVSGEYSYLGDGIATVKQNGSDVHMYLTWTPRGGGPHYEVKGKLTGNTIEGEWYALFSDQGWFRFHGVVSPSGDSIDCTASEDPIGSNIDRIILTKKD